MTKQTVHLIDHMGSDLTVVNAARVSMDKESDWAYVPYVGHDDLRHYQNVGLKEADIKLISYLAKHNHWTPFGHPQITFRIKAPIFVARQLGKHQVGMVWNEVSRRYVDSEPEFFEPEVWRKRANNVKQGSSDEPCYTQVGVKSGVARLTAEAEHTYHNLLMNGVCPEQARMVLPQSMMTEWYWTGSLAAWARVCKLRLDPHSQRETQEIAKMISDEVSKLFPVSWVALTNNTYGS